VVPGLRVAGAFLSSGKTDGTGRDRPTMHRMHTLHSGAVGVVGGGIMGSGIAEVTARAGFDVLVREVDAAAVERARERLASSLARAVRSGKSSDEERVATLGRVGFTCELGDLADRDVVIEAVVEEEAVKTSIFRELGGIVAPHCLLASNTSSIPIMKLAAAAAHPERVIGMHFFNPAPVLPLVEIVPSLLTSPRTVERATAFAGEQLGKRTVLSTDRAGFVVNALLIPYLLAAIRMVESGFATAEDVDTAMVAGCAHPMGPLALTDLIGLDTTHAVAESLYAEFKEPLYAPPPLLLRMVEAGLLGRKSGRGFFAYGGP
jgi:3-hydroxybutyryl-CoA dehydrogenase